MAKKPEETGTWIEYKKLVLHELERYETAIKELEIKLQKTANEVLTLKAKIYATAAAISVVVSIAFFFLRLLWQ